MADSRQTQMGKVAGVRPIVSVVCLGLAVSLLSACATPSPSLRNTDPFGRADARQDVAGIRRLIEDERFAEAIPRLLEAVAQSPESAAGLEARYLLGVAYAGMESYRDAIDVFKEYLRIAPDGPRAGECADRLAELKRQYRARFPDAEALNGRIRDLETKLRNVPDNLGLQWELAGLYWQRGDYKRAGALYAQIVRARPEYAEDATVRSRIEWTSDGAYVVLSPAEVQWRSEQAQPLEIVNVTGYRGGRDLFTREQRFYVVSGQAVNRSDSVLYGVRVIVTIYGFGNVVYDTRTVPIGRLHPGETRAFSVRFWNFEDLERIQRHECVGVFEG